MARNDLMLLVGLLGRFLDFYAGPGVNEAFLKFANYIVDACIQEYGFTDPEQIKFEADDRLLNYDRVMIDLDCDEAMIDLALKKT